MREYPKEYEIYKHFKGNLYQIVGLAEHTESGEMLVIYRGIYEHARVYARPLDIFMSRVDKRKYQDAEQEYRFELFDFGGEVVRPQDLKKQEAEREKEKAEQAEHVEYMDEEAVPPALLRFLEAESYEDKLDVLVSIRKELDDSMLNTIAMSLDIELPPDKESLEEKYDSVKTCLVTLEKYECNRLR